MKTDLEKSIEKNLMMVKENIRKAAKRVGRDPDGIDLVVVTKEKPASVVKALVECGVYKIGESYLQEAIFKIDILKDFAIEWHMIGNIQKGKEKHIAKIFQFVHSVGRVRTAEEINKYAGEDGGKIPIYLELNVSGEDTKHGWYAAQEDRWANLLPDFEHVLKLPFLKVVGFMTMAPYSLNPEDARPFFERMKRIREFVATNIPGSNIDGLSMGMSGDYEVAVEEGATVVRIGSAIVGPRG